MTLKVLDPLSAERLWKLFFPHLPRECGMTLVDELCAMHGIKLEVAAS